MWENILGIIGIAVWIVVVVSFAAGVTYVVVKISPADKPEKPAPAEPAEG